MKTLVIMAAGMGSRYGGLKQIDPVGPGGEIIIDYSVYDAYKAGFEKVVFIIRRENPEIFKELIGNKIEKHMKVSYVFQDVEKLPDGFAPIPGRVKPWGTAHAVMCCKGEVNEPFAVINADDFYGRDAFYELSRWMDGISGDKREYAMAGYVLENTLTENGHVSRGICEVGDDGYLNAITERTKIMLVDENACYEENGEWHGLDKKSTVSMNCWAFTPDFISEAEKRFEGFLNESTDNIERAEFFLPAVVCDMINENSVKVRVIKTNGKWMGVTYKEDREKVCASLREKIKDGEYPEKLWERI